jgi:hypothetical protein
MEKEFQRIVPSCLFIIRVYGGKSNKMKLRSLFFIAIAGVLSVSCMNVPCTGKTVNGVSVETINMRLSGKGLDIRFNEIIPPGEKKNYRGVYLTGFALSETEVSQHDYKLLISVDEPVLLGVGIRVCFKTGK